SPRVSSERGRAGLGFLRPAGARGACPGPRRRPRPKRGPGGPPPATPPAPERGRPAPSAGQAGKARPGRGKRKGEREREAPPPPPHTRTPPGKLRDWGRVRRERLNEWGAHVPEQAREQEEEGPAP